MRTPETASRIRCNRCGVFLPDYTYTNSLDMCDLCYDERMADAMAIWFDTPEQDYWQ